MSLSFLWSLTRPEIGKRVVACLIADPGWCLSLGGRGADQKQWKATTGNFLNDDDRGCEQK